jgi:hypothetical protein
MGSTRNKVVTYVAAVMLATGSVIAITSGSTAHAATADCGNNCLEPYSEEYGTADIASVDTGAVQTGQDILLAAAGANSAEDFLVIKEGLVSGLYQKGLVGNVVDEEWGTDLAYQYVYAPDGVLSGLCLGLADSAYSGEVVTLEPCGVNANTIWISMFEDENDVGYFPWINATDTVAGTPYVLTVIHGRLWIRGLNLELGIEPLSVVSGTVDPAQMWASEWGVLAG